MIERKQLLVSKKDGICTLTINRPERRNALTEEIVARLQMELPAAVEDALRIISIPFDTPKEVGYDSSAPKRVPDSDCRGVIFISGVYSYDRDDYRKMGRFPDDFPF